MLRLFKLTAILIFLYAPLALASNTEMPVANAVGGLMKSTSGQSYISIAVMMTLASVLPVLLMSATAFTRIIIVLSAIRLGLGMQSTPATPVLITLALCLTMFVMAPVGKEINSTALQPYLQERLNTAQFINKALVPLEQFMLKHTKESDLALMDELSIQQGMSVAEKSSTTTTVSPPIWQLLPAFMLSELKTAFQMAFVILLPFLLIDLLVSIGLMSLGMMMVPPTTIALPLKILMFVLVDGWALIAKSLVSGFN